MAQVKKCLVKTRIIRGCRNKQKSAENLIVPLRED